MWYIGRWSLPQNSQRSWGNDHRETAMLTAEKNESQAENGACDLNWVLQSYLQRVVG